MTDMAEHKMCKTCNGNGRIKLENMRSVQACKKCNGSGWIKCKPKNDQQ